MSRRLLQITILSLLACAATHAKLHRHEARLEHLSLPELEQELTSLNEELETLASLTMRRGVGAPGYRSNSYKDPNHCEWIRIDLEKETRIDTVVLAPLLIHEPQSGIQATGFPKAFRILAGTGQTTNELAVISTATNRLPRTAPLSISFPPAKAKWILIEASTLSHRIPSKEYTLELSEIMIFSGNENVALHRPVSVRSFFPKSASLITARSLVDGFTPYMMDAAYGAESKALLLHVTETNPLPRLTIDLSTSQPINQINLHSANLSYTIPMGNFTSWGVPRHVHVLGANQPDLSDATVLCEYRQDTVYDHGPIIMRRFPSKMCRYITIEILDHTPIVYSYDRRSLIAFSEIEILSNGHNAALHVPVTVSQNIKYPNIALERITDGLNYYGEILPQKVWMAQLSRRQDLENIRPLILSELDKRYKRQKTTLRLTRGLAAFLAAASLLVWLLHRRIQRRLKDRMTADLHDELGANVHGMRILNDMAQRAKENPDSLLTCLQKNREILDRTAMAIRHISDLRESQELFADLKSDLQRAAERILAEQDCQVKLEGEEYIHLLRQQTRIDLFLFYKECLINISRHSEATHISTNLKLTSQHIELIISDNGRGLADKKEGTIPPSLKRRAKLLRAKVEVMRPRAGGTEVHLSRRIRTIPSMLKRKRYHE